MAVPSLPMTCRDGSITISDGTGTPLTMTLDFEEGNFALDEVSHLQREVLELYDRDDLAALRYGRRKPVGWKATVYLKAFSDSSTKLALDAINKSGAWSAAVSTRGASEEVLTYRLVWTVERSNFGGSADATLTINHTTLRGTVNEEPGGFTKCELAGTAYLYADSDLVFA